MSGIVLSASVRQNLLSLQSTAQLLATTQNNLATGNKVNSALDNPTSYFTAQALNNRAGDINNLLDSIGNGVQVLQAANTGITSLQSLIANAQSIANQVLQAPTGYSTKSTLTSTAIAGATANNLLGTPGAFTNATVTGTAIAGAALTTTKLSALTSAVTTADSLTIDGKTIAFASSGGNVIAASGATLDLTNATVGDLLTAIDTITGTATPSTLGSTALTLSTGTAQDLVIGGTAGTLTKLGLTAGTTARAGGTTALGGLVLDIAATGNGTASAITFGTSAGQVSTLNGLNTALAANNLQASIDSTGVITITTTNNAASATIGAITGTATGSGKAFNGLTAAAPVADPNSQATRSSLVAQYNQVLAQINTTSQDSSFNGINLLNGDTLNLTFDETGASKLIDHWRDLQFRRPQPFEPYCGHRLPGRQLRQRHVEDADPGQHHAAHGSLRARFEPVGRADPPGLQQEPDQRAADRRVEPDAGRSERGSGQQPGAVDPPVDRGLRAGARQPVAAERAAAAALISSSRTPIETAGETPPFFVLAAAMSESLEWAGGVSVNRPLIKQLKPPLTLI